MYTRTRSARRRAPAALAVVAVLAFAMPSRAAEEPAPAEQKALGEVSLEEMLNVEVTSVSKKAESAFTAPSAIYVITAEDIRRSGLTSIPEILRMVPGLDVARIDSSNWAISARGFNNQFANKLLVLVDGRDVYNPIFAGVYWDVQDTFIEDIDRIEVIRGPGGTLWGANAVNGVINIITKPADKTQGALAWAAGGTEERAGGGGRWGGAIGENFHYRAYMKYWDRSDFELQGDPAGRDAQDDWQQTRGGGRFDWKAWQGGNITFLGDYYSGVDHASQTGVLPSPFPPYTQTFLGETENVEGGDVVTRVSHRFSDDSDLQFQVYYDRFRRSTDQPIGTGTSIKLDTVDLNFQHRFPLFWGQSVIWGAEYRRYQDDTRPGIRTLANHEFFIGFTPTGRTYELVSGFLQDEIPIIKDQLTFTAGTKIEYNAFSHLEYQPSARLGWLPHPDHYLWGAVSRAVRTPDRVEEDLIGDAQTFPIQPPQPTPFPVVGIARIVGNRHAKSESELAYELGYRVRPWSTASLDTALFYNDYHHLSSNEPVGQPQVQIQNPILVTAPAQFQNNGLGDTYGVETAFTWQALQAWRLTLNYTFLNMQLRRQTGSAFNPAMTEGQSPQHQAGIRSFVNLPYHLEFDSLLFYYDHLAGVPSYVRFDARLGWRPIEQVELSIVGQNLAYERHPEFPTSSVGAVPTDIQRGMYGKITFRF